MNKHCNESIECGNKLKYKSTHEMTESLLWLNKSKRQKIKYNGNLFSVDLHRSYVFNTILYSRNKQTYMLSFDCTIVFRFKRINNMSFIIWWLAYIHTKQLVGENWLLVWSREVWSIIMYNTKQVCDGWRQEHCHSPRISSIKPNYKSKQMIKENNIIDQTNIQCNINQLVLK